MARQTTSWVWINLPLLLALLLWETPWRTANAAELVMFRTAGCPYCARWDREIAPLYDKTDEGRRLPLRTIDMTAPRPADLKAIERIVFSPTFVVVERGQEVGRITGYTGQDFFWGLLGGIIKKLPTDKLSEQRVMTTEGRNP